MALSGWSIARPKEILMQQNLSTRRAHVKKRDNSALFANPGTGTEANEDNEDNVKFTVEFLVSNFGV